MCHAYWALFNRRNSRLLHRGLLLLVQQRHLSLPHRPRLVGVQNRCVIGEFVCFFFLVQCDRVVGTRVNLVRSGVVVSDVLGVAVFWGAGM